MVGKNKGVKKGSERNFQCKIQIFQLKCETPSEGGTRDLADEYYHTQTEISSHKIKIRKKWLPLLLIGS
jgi:hypothetical protein